MTPALRSPDATSSGAETSSSSTAAVPSAPPAAQTSVDDEYVSDDEEEYHDDDKDDLLLNALCVTGGTICAFGGIVSLLLGVLMAANKYTDAKTAWVPVFLIATGSVGFLLCGGCVALVITLLVSQDCVEDCGCCMEKPTDANAYHTMADQVVPV